MCQNLKAYFILIFLYKYLKYKNLLVIRLKILLKCKYMFLPVSIMLLWITKLEFIFASHLYQDEVRFLRSYNNSNSLLTSLFCSVSDSHLTVFSFAGSHSLAQQCNVMQATLNPSKVTLKFPLQQFHGHISGFAKHSFHNSFILGLSLHNRVPLNNIPCLETYYKNCYIKASYATALYGFSIFTLSRHVWDCSLHNKTFTHWSHYLCEVCNWHLKLIDGLGIGGSVGSTLAGGPGGQGFTFCSKNKLDIFQVCVWAVLHS